MTVARLLQPWEALRNPSRPVITRSRAVCGVAFLANSHAIGCKKRLASHPDPGATYSRWVLQSFPNDAAEPAAPAADLPVDAQPVPALLSLLSLGDVPPKEPVPPHQPTPGSGVPATPEPPPIIIDPEKGVIAPVQLPTPPHPPQRAVGNAGARP